MNAGQQKHTRKNTKAITETENENEWRMKQSLSDVTAMTEDGNDERRRAKCNQSGMCGNARCGAINCRAMRACPQDSGCRYGSQLRGVSGVGVHITSGSRGGQHGQNLNSNPPFCVSLYAIVKK